MSDALVSRSPFTCHPPCHWQLGFALFFVIVVASSMVASVVVDNVGFLGAPVIKTNKWTVLALLVTVAGAFPPAGPSASRTCVCMQLCNIGV